MVKFSFSLYLFISEFNSFIYCSILLTGCIDPGSYYFDDPADQVVSIELIHYDNPEAKEVFNYNLKAEKVLSFDFDKMKTLEVLPEENKDTFVDELAQDEFLMLWRHMDSPQGKCLKINYADETFTLCRFW